MTTSMQNRQALSATRILRFALLCTLLSTLAALVFYFGAEIRSIRGAFGALGFHAGLIGTGVALWFSARSGDSRLIAAAVLSLLPLGFWAWQIYRVIHV